MQGCNLRCPYCHNRALVLPDEDAERSLGGGELSSVEELFHHLEKRQGVLTALVLSGGEPLVNADETERILRKAKSLGYAVKLDTNGTMPEALERIVRDKSTKPDFIAMDMKTAPSRYGELLARGGRGDASGRGGGIASALKRTIEIMAEYPADCREWRTVLVETLVAENDIDEMAQVLPRDAVWCFAQFQPGGCVNSAYDMLLPMTSERAQSLVRRAQEKIAGAVLR